MSKSSMLIGSALLFAAAGLIGCTTAGQPTTASGTEHPQFETLCSKCHTLDRVEAAHKTMTPEQMKEIVKKMAAKEDSGIDPNSIDDIVNQIF